MDSIKVYALDDFIKKISYNLGLSYEKACVLLTLYILNNIQEDLIK